MLLTLPAILAEVTVEGLSLDELTLLANRALELCDLVVDDGRTADRVDARTIRFYQTLAIVPKPEYIGRSARYQREHLVRVIAAKQLQAEGFSLAQIQAALPARSTDDLTRALCSVQTARPTRGRQQMSPTRTNESAPKSAPSAPTEMRAFELCTGVTVLIDSRYQPDPTALLHALTQAAAATALPHVSTPSTQASVHPRTNTGGNP